MKHSLLRIALLASLAFNAAVLAGFFYSKRVSASNGFNLAPVYRQLGLTPQQLQELSTIRDQVFQDVAGSKERMRQTWTEGVSLLAEPELDWARIQTKRAELEQVQGRYQAVFFRSWMEQARVLTPEQRRTLFRSLQSQIDNGAFFRWRPPESLDSKRSR